MEAAELEIRIIERLHALRNTATSVLYDREIRKERYQECRDLCAELVDGFNQLEKLRNGGG